MQMPIQTRGIIDASKGWRDNTQDQAGAANAIVDYYSSSIAHFVQAQRRDYASGNVQVRRRTYALPGLSMTYENYQGQERLTLTVYPENAPPTGAPLQDINNDGYITFILYDPHFPNLFNGKAGFPKSYDIYLNGYLIVQGWQIDRAAQAFVVMFGLTALRCQSLVDKQHLNPFENKSNGGLTKPVLPHRQQVGGHDDLPAYLLFDFTTTNNPVYNQNYLNQIGGDDPVRIQVTGGIQFFDPLKSPLNTKRGNSTNYFGVALSHGVVQETEDSIAYIMFTEFFSRTKLRSASQSWNKTATPGNGIVVNDKPLYWGSTHITSYTALTPGQNAMGFDLFDEKGAATDDLAPVDLSGTAGNFARFGQSILSSADDDLLNYYAEVARIELEFANQELPILRVLQARAIAARTVVNDDELELKKAREALLALDDQIALYETLDPAIYGIVLGNDIALLPSYKQRVSKDDDTLTADLKIMNAADDAFNAEAGKNPVLPEAPIIQSDDINKFRYRTVAVSGDDWIFGGWQGG